MNITHLRTALFLGAVLFLSSCGPQSPTSQHSKKAELTVGCIIGGDPVTENGCSSQIEESWENTVALVSKGEAFCTGTLIHSQVVITAGHCLEGQNLSEIEIHIGNGKESGRHLPTQFKVKRGKINPLYYKHLLGNSDTGYLLLERPVENVRLVPVLSKYDEIETALRPGNLVRLVGFGVRDMQDQTKFGRKFQVETKVHERNSSEILLGENGKDSCFGDSGGPAFVRLPNQKWRAFGVVSRGTGTECGKGERPGIYGLMHDSLCWIQKDLNNHLDSQGIKLAADFSLCLNQNERTNSFEQGDKALPVNLLNQDFLSLCHHPHYESMAHTFKALKYATQTQSCTDLWELLKTTRSLQLSGRYLEDLTPLAFIPQLEELDVSDNRLTKIGAILNIASLKRLDLTWNSIEKTEVVKLKETLPDLQISGEQLQTHNYFDNKFYRLCQEIVSAKNVYETRVVEAIKKASPEKTCRNISARIMSQRHLSLSAPGELDLSVLAGFSTLNQLILKTTMGDFSALTPLKDLQFLGITSFRPVELAPLAQLPHLQTLLLTGRGVSDPESLATLQSLKALSLTVLTGVDDLTSYVTPLKALPHLRTLHLLKNNLNHIEGLAELPSLEELVLDRNSIQDLTPLAQLKRLRVLKLAQNQIQDVRVLENLPHLEVVDLSENEITDLSSLSQAKNLRILKASETKLQDLSFLQTLPRLEVVNLDLVPLQNLDSVFMALQGAKNLRELHLAGSRISSLEGLSELTSLQVLDLQGNQLEKVPVLRALQNLRALLLSFNPLKDFSELQRVISLQQLALDYVQIGERLEQVVENLRPLPNLLALSLMGNNLENVSSLVHLQKLEFLNLSQNLIHDLTPLSGLMDMREFHGASNPLTEKHCPFQDPQVCRSL